MRCLYTSPYYIIKKLQDACLTRLLPEPKGRVLDAGCGSMPYQKHFSSCTYISLDNCATHCPRACGTCSAIPFKDESFDIVVCTEVLEHMPDMRAALKELSRVVKKGGLLYISVPQSWPLHYQPYDFWRITQYGLACLLRQDGLRVIETARIGGLFSLIVQHSIDSAWTLLARSLGFLGARNAERAASALCLPASLLLYYPAALGDRLDPRFALGNAVLARK